MYFPFGVAGFSSPDPRTGGWCWCPRVFGLGAGTGGVSGDCQEDGDGGDGGGGDEVVGRGTPPAFGDGGRGVELVWWRGRP